MPLGKGYNDKGMNDKGDMKSRMMLDGSRNAVPPANPNGRIDPGPTPMMRRTRTMTQPKRSASEMVPKGAKTPV